MSLFGEQRRIFYRVLIAEMYVNPHWGVWSTHDTQREAYEAVTSYRESYPGEKGLTPLRIVRVVDEGKDADEEDRTFIDETGAGLAEWARLIEANEVEWES